MRDVQAYKEKRGGFSIVELQLAIVGLAIFTLLVGMVLIHGWKSWGTSNQIVNMQRESSLAFKILTRELRISDIDQITSGNPLICSNTNGTTRFEWSANRFSISGAHNETLLSGSVMDFSSIKSNGLVMLSMDVEWNGVKNSQIVWVHPRN